MHKAVKNRIYFTVFSAIIIAIVGGVLVWQLQKNMVFFYTPTDIILQPKSDKNIWLGGIVKSYKMQENKGEVLHIFVITDNKTDIAIEYYGVLPSLFKIGQGAVIYGKIVDKILYANRVAIKHDEVYMTPEKYAKLRK